MAVYTAIGQAEIEAFLDGYDIGRCIELTGIAEGVENSNYCIETDRGRFILTIYERRVDPAELPFFLGLLDHLAARGVPCPVPVKARTGEILGRIAGKPAAIVTFLEGRSPRRLTIARCRALGATLAQLHEAGRDFTMTRPNALAMTAWRPLFEQCLASPGEVPAALAKEIAAELDQVEQQWPHHLPRGVIHADLFPDNVFFAEDTVTGVIDFYFACTDLFAYDVAICLNAWCFEPTGEFNITKAKALLDGYGRRRPLSEEEVSALPVLCRGACLRFFLTRLYDWLNHVEGALVRPKDPAEYLKKLRFHRNIAGPASYGLR